METLLYSIVRFAPFSETEEFANIGIVLVSPSLNFFDFKLQRKKFSRVTHFFGETSPALFRAAVGNLQDELSRMKRVSNQNMRQPSFQFKDQSVANLMLQELLRKREGMIRFSEIRMTVANDAASELDRLNRYYVDKEFITPVYTELVMEREIRQSLKALEMSGRYSAVRLRDGVYQAKFPFVHQSDTGIADSIIKPISLSQERPETIIEHANKWAYALKRLRTARRIQGEVLFPVRKPEQETPSRYAAYLEARELLESEGGTVVLSTDAETISREFRLR